MIMKLSTALSICMLLVFFSISSVVASIFGAPELFRILSKSLFVSALILGAIFLLGFWLGIVRDDMSKE